MANNFSSETPCTGPEISNLSPVDTAIYELKEHLLVDDEFSQEWKKYCPFHKDGNDMIASINAMRTHTIEVLQALILTTESLNLHIDSGTINIADKFKKFKQTLQKCLNDLKRDQAYEMKHFVGRAKDIESVMKVFSRDLRDCYNTNYIGKTSKRVICHTERHTDAKVNTVTDASCYDENGCIHILYRG